MKTLVFDTCLNKTYVTFSAENEILRSITVENKEEKYHSAFLISTIVKILKEFNLQIKDMDAFGVNVGPGSFTGIRACITVARVFAQQAQKPLVGVSSLEILSGLNETEKNSLILAYARRNQFYSAAYSTDGTELIKPHLMEIESLESLPLQDSFIICDTATKAILDEKGIECIDYNSQNTDLGILLSKLVNKKIKTNTDYFWANTKPLYLQTPPISTKKVPTLPQTK